MSKLLVESEYDMDNAIAEVIKLARLQNASLDVGFNNIKMVDIFLTNLHGALLDNKVEPGNKNFHLNIMVKANEQT
jgi:hypothetical protein